MPLHSPMTMLVLDDEPSFVRALAALLRRDGHAVDTADHGSRALSQLEEHPYDVLLCDRRMPELDGSTFSNMDLREGTCDQTSFEGCVGCPLCRF